MMDVEQSSNTVAESDSDILIGRAFHTVDARGRTVWQGEVLEHLGHGYYLLQLFEWFSGHESTQHVVSLAQLAAVHPSGLPVYRLFYNINDANSYMENVARHRDAQIDSEVVQND